MAQNAPFKLGFLLPKAEREKMEKKENSNDGERSENNCNRFHESIQTVKDNILRIIENKDTRPLGDKAIVKNEVNKKNFAQKKKGVWNSIQSFHTSLGSVRLEGMLQMHVDKNIRDKFPNLDEGEKETKVRDLLRNAGFKYLTSDELRDFRSSLAELQVDEAITRIMQGRAGLLLRNLRCKENKKFKMGRFQFLKGILSDNFLPYCQDKDHPHVQRCHDGETDSILLYPGEEKLHVVIIEAKSEEKDKEGRINKKTIEEGLDQLRRDVILIHNLLPDIPKEKLDIKFFLALPSKEAKEYGFCDKCLNHIITKEHLTGTKESSTELRRKLRIQDSNEKVKLNDDEEISHSQDLLLTAASRFIDQQQNVVYDKELQNFVIKFENGMENLIVFDDDQSESVGVAEKNPKITNFIFRGAPGTGKTLLAIRTIQDLLKRHHTLGRKKIYIYALAARGMNQGKTSKLLTVFQENITIPKYLETENIDIKIFCGDFVELCKEYSDEHFKGVLDLKAIVFLRRKLTEQHSDAQVILFIDELEINETWDSAKVWDEISLTVIDTNYVKPNPQIDQARQFNMLKWVALPKHQLMAEFPGLLPSDNSDLILAFNPGTSQTNDFALAENPRNFGEDNNDEEWFSTLPERQLHPVLCEFRSPMRVKGNIPENCYIKHLTLRYRNSYNIQKFTKFIMENMGTEAGESRVASNEGDIPVWIDIGRYTDEEGPGNLALALNELLSLSTKYGNGNILLHEDPDKYDMKDEETGHIQKPLRVFAEQIKGLENPRRIEVADDSRGCDEECVIYVGGGDLEAFCRAKQWLGIITFYGGIYENGDNSEYDDNLFVQMKKSRGEIYKDYKEVLTQAVDEGFLIKLNQYLGPDFNSAAAESGPY